MSDDDDVGQEQERRVRQEHERRLSGLQGAHESLRDQISDLEAKDDLEAWEERQLQELRNRLDGLEREMDDIERHL